VCVCVFAVTPYQTQTHTHTSRIADALLTLQVSALQTHLDLGNDRLDKLYGKFRV
jgi:hypothetical protein